MLEIYVDADACPFKQEVCKVAKRNRLNVTFVSNTLMRIPDQEGAKLVVVEGQFDAADNWIVEHISKDDIVVTTDIPLAYRCVKRGAQVLGPTGRILSDANIGQVLATRDLLTELREAGTIKGGPPPLQKRDRSRFLQSLEQIIQNIKRAI
ncbi:MAG: YaiI/YqxD family protein [Thermodesulfobacteriota bacterium]|nr:MAG: YaiI/YqxD family protein [Thermodesulfobacteriota bacterium]